MPQFTEFPVLPKGEYSSAVDAFIRFIRSTPAEGEKFSDFRKRLKKAGMWNRERLVGLLRFLQIPHSDPIVPSDLMKSIADADGLEPARDILTKRLWHINPLIFKAVLERLEERVHSPNELFKYIDSFAYPGARMSHPEVRNWICLAQGLGILMPVGIRVKMDKRGQAYVEEARDLDIEDFLDEDEEEVWPPPSSAPEGGEGEAAGAPVETSGAPAAPSAAAQPQPLPQASPSVVYAPPASTAPAPAPAPAPARGGPRPPIALPDDLPSPHGKGRPVRVEQFRGSGPLKESLRAALGEQLTAWWSELTPASDPYPIDDFGLDAEAWMEDAQRALFRLAVGAAMVFRLGRTPDQVRQAFEALDAAGLLDDLYLGTVPDVPPVNVDPQALMLASLVARRLAEWPELATELERKKTAEEVLQAFDQALGRGLFAIELFWLLRRLGQLGVVRVQGADEIKALPTRALRETLFRLGLLDTPYAGDVTALAQASAAARAIIPSPHAADEALLAFTTAAGCRFDCPSRKRCGFPCRERTDLG